MTFKDSSLEMRAHRLVFPNLIQRILFVLAISIVANVASSACAQNPFALGPTKQALPTSDPDNNIGGLPGGGMFFFDHPANWDRDKKDLWESLPADIRVVIESIRNSNPRTPVELANAIRTLLDIKRFGEARFYLEQLDKSGNDPSKLFDLYEEMGADFFLRLHAEDGLRPLGATYSSRVSKVVRKESFSLARIDSYIKNLNDSDLALRSENFRRLRRLGEPAIARMLEVFVDSSRKSEFKMIRFSLQRMGEQATWPLVGATRADNPTVQSEAILALGSVKSRLAIDTLMRAYLSPKMPESVRELAKSALAARHGTLPTVEEAQQVLKTKSMDYLLGRSPLGNSASEFISVWSWQSRSNRLVERQVTKAIASRIVASHLASDLYEINPGDSENRQIFLLTQLESLKRLAGPDRKIDVNEIKRRVAGVTALELNHVLVRALDLHLIAAATATCEVLGNVGTREDLTWSASQMCPLIQAIVHGQRHLQFAALHAIVEIDPKQAYRGSSYVLSAAVFLANTNGQSSAVVGHKQIGTAQSFSSFLARTQIYGQAVSTGRDLFKHAAADPDIDFLIITDSLQTPYYQELIFQLRRDWRTRNLPIGVMFSDVSKKQHAMRAFRDDPLVEVMPLTQNSQLIDSQVRRLKNKNLPWQTTQEQRIRHADFLVDWLGLIASNRDDYRFYNLMAHESELVGLLFKPGRARAASVVLAQLGTPESQRALVQYANQESSPINDRQAAVAAFKIAINRTATMLTAKEIQRQYDRFNSSERESQQSQKVLGQILDAIEVRSGR